MPTLGIQTQQPLSAIPFIRETHSAVVKVISSEFSESDARAILAASPNTQLAWRCYWQGQPAPGEAPIEGVVATYAAQILVSSAVQAGLVTYVEAHSEGFNYGYGIDGTAWDAYFVEMCDLLEPHGLKVIVGCFGTGNGDAAWWLDTLPQTCRRATYFGFQEYGWPVMQAQQSLPGAPYHALRHKDIIAAIRQVNPKAVPVIVECGLTQLVLGEGHADVGYWAVPKTPQQFVDEDMRWYMAVVDPQAIVLWYGVAMYEQWDATFGMDTPEIRAAWPMLAALQSPDPMDYPMDFPIGFPIGFPPFGYIAEPTEPIPPQEGTMPTQQQINLALDVLWGIGRVLKGEQSLPGDTLPNLGQQLQDASIILKEAARPLP